MKTILNTQACVGQIVHAYGARFAITEIHNYALSNNAQLQGPENVAVNIAVWLDGAIEPGYFGPGIDWNFQGNANARIFVE